jgi:hypothetical protein
VAEVFGRDSLCLLFRQHALRRLAKRVAVVVYAEDDALLRAYGVERGASLVGERELPFPPVLVAAGFDFQEGRALRVVLRHLQNVEHFGAHALLVLKNEARPDREPFHLFAFRPLR